MGVFDRVYNFDLFFSFQHVCIGQQLPSSLGFSPTVTATCKNDQMTVKVETSDNFLGVVQSRDYRKPECSGYGENTRITYLRIDMSARSEQNDYCGVFINKVMDLMSN